jgi:hypothetical protein
MGTSGEAMILMEELAAVSSQAIRHPQKTRCVRQHPGNEAWGNEDKRELLSSQLGDLKNAKARIRVDARPCGPPQTVEEIFLMADGFPSVRSMPRFSR